MFFTCWRTIACLALRRRASQQDIRGRRSAKFGCRCVVDLLRAMERNRVDRVSGWVGEKLRRHRQTVELDGELFAAVPAGLLPLLPFNRRSPRLDYLTGLFYALAQQIADAWSFEAMLAAGRQPLHFTLRLADGPSWFSGSRQLNPAAILYLDRKHAALPHRTLVREAIGIGSPMLFNSIQMLTRTKHAIRRRLAGVKKRVTARAP